MKKLFLGLLAALILLSSFLAHSEDNRVVMNSIVSFIPERLKSYAYSQVSLGKMDFPSGVVVACDPFYVGNADLAAPFKQKIKSGKYVAGVIKANIPTVGERNILAYLVLQNKKVVKWEQAEVVKEDVMFKSKYGVDSGLGAFFDKDTAQQFNNTLKDYMQKKPNEDYYNDVILGGKEADTVAYSSLVKVAPHSDLHFALFSSGIGDGIYPSYWGLDDQNNPVALVTSFENEYMYRE
ncbi:DUF4241 domain-containing protein [Thiolinea disciformis]|uniref:DUF4241 domain-containing protein n=1 Tax=Thiolinea disciformis TaxID=125614 RepID=UPI00037A4026|nr:DUF4241 domain-containing protein [Thiolinea disciformis]